jgi:hypothetical protein
MSSEENVLTPTRAFVALTLFDMIRMPLALLPLLIVYIIEVKRKKYLSVSNGKMALNFGPSIMVSFVFMTSSSIIKQ